MLFAWAVALFPFPAAAGSWLINAWDSETGLPDNYATSIVQTPDGYLWVGTYNGLARFDGQQFVVFNPENTPQLSHSRIVKLFLDAQGTLWINTYDGSLTSYRHGVFTHEWNGAGKGISEVWLVAANAREITFSFRSGLLITRPASAGAAADWHVLVPPVELHGVCYSEDQAGGLWACTVDGQLWRITDDRYELLSLPLAGLRGKAIHWLTADANGRIWAGTETEIAAWDGQRFQDMTPPGEPVLNVAALYFTKTGRLLVGANGRLREWRNRLWVAEYPAWPDLMQEQQLMPSLYEDREGGLWRVSRGLGLYHIRPDGTSEQITRTNGLPGDHTTACLEDQEGDLWVTLANAGMARLRPGHFTVLGMSDGPEANPVMSVCEDHAGALWAGTYGGGLYRWQNGALTHFPVHADTPGDFVFSIYPDATDRLWLSAGLEDALLFHQDRLQPPPVAVHAIKAILVDHQGRVWLGRKDGVECWADGKLRDWSSHTSFIYSPVRALAEDRQGVIWMGADNGILYRFADDRLQTIRLPDFPAHKAVWCLLPDPDGSLWIGTFESGLLHYEAGRFFRFTAQDGLPDNLICQILDDQHGHLWLGTHHGIARVGKAALSAFASGQAPEITCSVYDRSDGLPTLQCSDMYQPGAWRGHDGRLWFATGKGVVGLQPGDMPVNTRPPPVMIEEFLADGKIQPLPADDGPGSAVLKIPAGRQNFEFHYTALSLINANKIRFRYRLEGFDADWISAGNRRWVQYNYLKPGNYCFRVAACNNDGRWNETGASLRLRLLPHFWETWWFLTLLGLAVAASAAGLARYVSHRGLRRELERMERQRDIESVRARIARDIHDSLGSGLTRINLLSELLLGDSAAQQARSVSQITSVTCELMRSMDEIVWAVNPKNDTLDALLSYVCDFADARLRAASLRLRIRLPAPLPVWQLTSEVRHTLFLAVKEILNEVIQHPGLGEVSLTLELDDTQATLAIQSPGPGRPMAPGQIPDLLRQRLATIGARCSITPLPGGGARAELIFPRQIRTEADHQSDQAILFGASPNSK